MRTETPPMVKRADYRPYPFKIDQVHLRFDLSPDKTRVVSTLSGQRVSGEHSAMHLNGEALKLLRVTLNGEELAATQYDLTPEGLSIPMKEGAFKLEIETEISPTSNTELSGLYMSGGRFCTQCEAEGFRRITYYPDRPDVLARFHVRMEADASYPFLLSNGNPGKPASWTVGVTLQNGMTLTQNLHICSRWWQAILMFIATVSRPGPTRRRRLRSLSTRETPTAPPTPWIH